MKPKLITAEMLEKTGAQCDQVDIFRTEWPDGGEVTMDNINRATELGLDITWFAYNLLSAPAREVYLKATATAWEAYQTATAPAWQAFLKATAPAWEALLKAIGTALYEAWQIMK